MATAQGRTTIRRKPRQGDPGIAGCIIRTTEWTAGFEYHNDEAETQGTRFLDIVTVTSGSTILRYKCIKSHTSGATFAVGVNWEIMNSLSPIYTPMLFTPKALINFLQSNQLLAGSVDAQGHMSGVALGAGVVEVNGVAKTGIFGIKDGVVTFSIDGAGNVSGDGKFSAGDSNGKIVLDPTKKSAVLYNSNGTIIGAFGFFQTNGSWDYSQAIMELYTYSGTTLVGKARISPSGMSLEKNGVTLFEAKAAPSDMGTHSIVNLNIPDDPNKVEVGQLYRNAGDGIVRVRLIP